MTPTVITAIAARTLDVGLHKPFGIAGGAQEVARNVLVRVELADGAVGWGEGAPFPAFNGETQEGTLAALARARAEVLGIDAADEDALAERVARGAGPCGAARCALETAALDARWRGLGRRLFGAPPAELVTDVTIPVGDLPASARDARDWAARGFGRLKVKIGGAGLEDALARVRAVHEAAPAAELMLDGNAGLTAEDAVALLVALRARGIRPVLFEQPCPADDVAGLRDVAAASDVPVALDESATSCAALDRFDAGFVVNVKVMKAGLVEASRVVHHAVVRGMGLMIGGMVETRLAMGASACLVAARGEGRFAWVDLDTPLFLASDPFDGGYAQRGPVLDLAPITGGHGCSPRDRRASA